MILLRGRALAKRRLHPKMDRFYWMVTIAAQESRIIHDMMK